MRRDPAPDADQLDALFFALASEPRRRILDVLKREPGCNVNRVCEHFDNEIGRFAVMKHLTTLEAADLVIAERSGRERLLWFNPTPIQWIHQRWTTEFSAYWAARLTQLKFSAEGAEVTRLPTPPKKGRRHG
ncbi:ArsR/SmtB family transcription factor [Rivibacter subsaxonicus]|uniref:DNA-binding transcriptional ArsR family regulator n=1 Tax=Rivibacter subsaxonicus TaxID=457575 RepID=A0A4Q7W240_9BURK|nr:helix-turn-helix transcriptional regulator [Rivibacter subsaxonicus]RZU02955.1 DNA-binding transcriptional ArsR family regulator [Rivibacter subsaxonicus]